MDLTEELGQLDLLTTDGPFTMKEITQIISDLKKDNFNLRLRIFFYEERLQQRCDDSVEEMYKTNIDLKVEVETLKEEMKELHRVSALALQDYPEQMEQLREYYNTKIQQLGKDLDSSRVEVGKLPTMLEQERTHCLEMEKELQGEVHSQSDISTQTDHSQLDTPTQPEHSQSDAPTQTDPLSKEQEPDQNPEKFQDLLSLLEERDWLIEQLQASVKSQEALIDQLRYSSAGQGSGDQPSADPDRQLSSLIAQREMDLQEMQDVMAEKDFQLAECEFKVKEQEAAILKLNRKIHEKDSEKKKAVRSSDGVTDTIGQLQACLREKEKELLTLNNLLFSHEDTIHTLENELANEKVKYDSKTKELQDALEQSNEEMAEKDFLLTEKEIHMKELEAAVKTFNCTLQEKDKLLQEGHVCTCPDITTGHHQESVFQQQVEKVKENSERAREELLSVVEQNNREIERLQKALLDIQTHPPAQEGLLSHIQDAINSVDALMRQRDIEMAQTRDVFNRLQGARQELEESLCQTLQDKDRSFAHLQVTLDRKNKDMEVMAGQFHSQMEESNRELERLEQRLRETKGMLAQTNADKQSQLTDHQLTVEEIQSATSINAQVLKSLESVMKGLDQELQEKDYIISQLQEVVNKNSEDLEIMVGRLHSQAVGSNKELEQLEQRLKETEAILLQTTQEKETQMTDHQLEIEKLQGEAKDSNRKLEQLEEKLKEMEDILSHTAGKYLQDNQLTDRKLQGQAEDRDRKLEQLEQKLKETVDILAQITDDKDKLLLENQLAEQKLQSQTEDSSMKLEQLDQMLKEKDLLFMQSTADKEIQLTNYKLTVEKLMSYITINEQMFKELREHHRQILAKHTLELEDYGKRQEKLSTAQIQISASLQEKCSEVSELRLLTEREQVIKGLEHFAVQREGGRTNPCQRETLDPDNHTIPENSEVPSTEAGPAKCERCLQLLQRENGSLLVRLRASKRLNKTLRSQLDLCRSIMAQREGSDGRSFSPSNSLTVEEEMKEQLQEILRLRQSLEESIQANRRLQEHLKNHKAQQAATQIGAQQAGTEMGQNHPGVHAESERLKASLVETACELTRLQRESDMLREERERLTEGLAHSEDNNRSLESSLSSTQEEIDRLKGELDAYQKQLTNSNELLKSFCEEMQGSKQMRTAAVNPTASEFGGGLPDNPKLNQLLSEIQRIRAQLADKDTIQTKATEEKHPEHSGWPECPPKIININYVECGASRHSSRSSPSGTRRRDHAKKDNDNLSQSSLTSSIDDSVPSLLNSSLSSLWANDKSPNVTGQEDDCINLQRLISEGKTMTNKMSRLLQECHNNNSNPTSQSAVDQKYIKHLSSTISACHLLRLQERRSQSDSVNIYQSQEDFYLENLKLKNKIEIMKREQSQNKKMLSEAVKRLRRVNLGKVERVTRGLSVPYANASLEPNQVQSVEDLYTAEDYKPLSREPTEEDLQ
ncbi:CDK5 regulatory subunit-associated protein 2-like [Salvelinus namaycush]|uniref:CDK5 regulatory subunit-associated protein 2-like n=1 Tax=Salvelinus namaycush TaxID=8040 RepID=A0A8U0PLJ2_SALNM|nr:CDK5 regulatory subunit-associated protein 2-like [Salvelinus namaycush]